MRLSIRRWVIGSLPVNLPCWLAWSVRRLTVTKLRLHLHAHIRKLGANPQRQSIPRSMVLQPATQIHTSLPDISVKSRPTSQLSLHKRRLPLATHNHRLELQASIARHSKLRPWMTAPLPWLTFPLASPSSTFHIPHILCLSLTLKPPNIRPALPFYNLNHHGHECCRHDESGCCNAQGYS
jgi:hypothetical protein